MTVDMRLISIKDGGRFAMSWIAGTNPKALRSNTHRTHVYTVDVPVVCKDIMKCIRQKKNNSMSFRILFRLCFGTIKIFSEQVQHLYNVTLNFMCFNTFFLKQYSRKRSSARVAKNENKKRRMGSIDDLDITNLLMESEVFNEYSEEKFEFPPDINVKSQKKQATSTCIHIKEITIKQISWDCPQPDEEDAFGEASQDERNMLLSAISGREDDVTSEKRSICYKRKAPIDVTHHSPMKKRERDGILDNSIEEIRCTAESVYDVPLSELNIDYRSHSVAESQMNAPDIDEKRMTLDETISSHQMYLATCQPQNDPLPVSPKALNAQENELNTNLQDNPTFVRDVKSQSRKRPKSHLIIDKFTKLAKKDFDYCKNNIWDNCFNSVKKEHMINKFNNIALFTLHPGPTRFPKLLGTFKNNFKSDQKQNADQNRRLLIEEILEDDYETYKSEFKLTTTKKSRSSARNAPDSSQPRHETSILPFIDENIDLNNKCKEFDECSREATNVKNALTLNCSLDEIDLNKIQFDFPNDAETQSLKSKWGKEGILRKLLSLWKTKDPHIRMTTLIVGASRINAALAFHTLLDLAGQQYVEIIKDDNNSIKFINMGPEMIRKINKLCT